MASFDIAAGALGTSRDVLDEAKAEALAAELRSAQEAGCTEIRLTGKSFTREAAAIVAPVLSAMSGLVKVDMSDVIASRPEDEGLDVLRTLSGALVGSKDTLVELNLSDNALGEKGIRACAALLEEFEALRRLYLENNGLSAEACALIAEVLMFRGEEEELPLTLFHFHDNMCGDLGGVNLSKLVAKLTQVTSLRFSKTRCGREGCAAIAAAVASCEALEVANFEDVTFGGDGAAVLARSLEKCPSLRHLNVRDSMLEEEGAEELLEMLSTNAEGLEFLDLSGNDLMADSVEKVVACLKEKPALKYLALDDNEIGNKGVFLLGQAITTPGQFPALTTLSLKGCDVSAAGATFLARVVAARGLESAPLDGNFISEAGLEECAALLESAGGIDVFGPLEDNDEDFEEEEDDEDIAEIKAFDVSKLGAAAPAEDAAADDLADALAKTTI
eukprot:CAMPEP_0118856496 /NCGR_PEP_ID=MMETSP1163-20130328/3943_1 /TAXON_ID=124430 /ORGANISM="Phaeomonas parva, Strain CCMP2877" /LENGTH=445 /DNA_ID=CAMNT_0006789611 /DNA_START=52 /DNA_END=1389 /DNA_ORIENTATION=-